MKREILEEFNSWWFTGKVPEELLQKYRRTLFRQVIDSINKRQINSIVGLRRTGKTTLIFQIIDRLLEEKVEKTNILYFNFDEYVESLDELLNSYKEMQRKELREDKVYIFLDEIQKLNNWENQIKKLYDLYPKIKFVVSGSESLFVTTKTKETLAGRIYEFLLKPLSFKEFIEIKGLQTNLPETRLRTLFAEYIENGGFPEIIGKSKEERKEYVKSVVLDKIIFKDIVKLFGIKDTDTLKHLMEIISTNPGMYLEYQSLAQELGKDRRSIKSYIQLLNESFLIKFFGNYRKGKAASLRKIKRVYPVDSSIIYTFKSIIDDQFTGKIVESIVANNIETNIFWKDKYEVDFVLDGIPIEVKYKSKIIARDLEGIREFMRKFSVKKGIMLTKEEGKIKVEEGEIFLIPIWKFLLYSEQQSKLERAVY